MSNETIEIARSGINAFNKKDWDAASVLMADGATYDEVATHRNLKGPEILESWKGWAAAFPNVVGDITSSYSDGDTAFIQVTWNGKHTGPMMTPNGEIPATNKDISLRAVQITKVTNGKIAEQTHYFDMATMMTQLGLAG